MLQKNDLKKTDIFKICSSLNKQEAAKCLVFLTEFTSASKKCRTLYDEIYKLYKRKKYSWQDVNISISKLNQKVMGKADDNNAARVLRSELYRNIVKYCSFLEFQKKQLTGEYHQLLDYLSRRQVDELFNKEYNKFQKNNKHKLGVDYTFQECLSYQAFLELMLKDQSKKNQVDYHLNYQNFVNYSIIKKIQNYSLFLNYNLINKQETHSHIELEVEKLFKQAEDIPNIQQIIELYKSACLMLKNNSDQYFKLKSMMNDNISNISKKDKQILYIFMHNFCIRSNDPNLVYESRINHLKRFEEGLIHEGEFIKLMNAKALCTTVLSLTKTVDESKRMTRSEAEEKIKEIVNQMPPRYRKSTEYFHLVVLDYYFEDYITASKRLKDSPKYPNAFFDFDARMILQRCYYFLEDIDEFDKGIRNFQGALNNDQELSEKHKTEYSNFTRAIQILHNAKLIHDKSDKKKLLEKLEVFLQKKPVKILNWFNAQIQTLH